MAIETQMEYNYIKAADAKKAAENSKAGKTAGNATTSRGTLITKSNTEFSKDSFLKILAAQLSHLDPTQDQDSSAYVAQMAQFAGMEQMQNLNNTMSDSAYQQMVGKIVVLNQKDASNNYVEGSVTGVIKKSGVTYLQMYIDGKAEEVDVKNVIGSAETTDATATSNAIANNRAALNSDFLAASALAAGNKSVVIEVVGTDKSTTLVKGNVTGAYIDTLNSPVVKVKVDVTDAAGNKTNKTYEYGAIVRAGDLTTEEMNVTLPTPATTPTPTTTPTTSTNTSHIDYPYPDVVIKQ